MKVSISKFYKEVTGKTTVNRGTCVGALNRWGVPFDDIYANGSRKGDAVEISHLEAAKKIYAGEEAAREKTRAAVRTAKPPRLVDDAALLEMLVRLDDNTARTAATVAAIALHLKVKV